MVLQRRVEELIFRKLAVVDQPELIIKEYTNMTPRVTISEPHILDTNQLHSVICNSLEKEESGAGAPGRGDQTQVERPAPEVEPPGQRMEIKKRQVGVDLPMILQACPEFAAWGRNLGGYICDWRDFVRVASELRTMIGVSEHAWHHAQEQMGKPMAAAALALIFEKVHSGDVASPGGYLRGMVEKAEAGELHLERSFFGRLSGRAA
jgi:replication initiation protein RepC